MRISSVNNYNQTHALAFGKFADKNARNVIKEALLINDPIMKPIYDSWFKRIEDCDFFEAYTDEETNKVKGRFTDEFIKSHADNKVIIRRIGTFKQYGNMEDLSTTYSAKNVASELSDIEELANGVDLSLRCRSEKPFGDAREDEWAREEFLNNLAD